MNESFYKEVQKEFLQNRPWTFFYHFPVVIVEDGPEFFSKTKETKVVNKYHVGDKFDVYIGRGSVWGNPYTHRELKNTKAEFQTVSREESIEKYRKYLLNNKELMSLLPTLKGKTLACFCKPNSCHGDVLAELANKL